MRESVAIPVTVKCRLGIDDQPTDEPLDRFVAAVKEAGCGTLILHARKAWLKGLSPRDNRDVPPLDYERVYRLKRDHPEAEIVLNGGIRSLEEAEAHLRHVDGVMLGRAAYEQPYLLGGVDQRFFASVAPVLSREQILAQFMPYVRAELARGTPLARIARHILGLYHGVFGGRIFRRIVSEHGGAPGAGVDVLRQAIAATMVPQKLMAAE
jgi:tRNA-dihydrouridine synthase A